MLLVFPFTDKRRVVESAVKPTTAEVEAGTIFVEFRNCAFVGEAKIVAFTPRNVVSIFPSKKIVYLDVADVVPPCKRTEFMALYVVPVVPFRAAINTLVAALVVKFGIFEPSVKIHRALAS